MALRNNIFKNASDQVAEQSVSWGSLLTLIAALTGLIIMMSSFAQ